jgi:hypothetical protein
MAQQDRDAGPNIRLETERVRILMSLAHNSDLAFEALKRLAGKGHTQAIDVKLWNTFSTVLQCWRSNGFRVETPEPGGDRGMTEEEQMIADRRACTGSRLGAYASDD